MKKGNTALTLVVILAALSVAALAYMFAFKPALDARQAAIDATEVARSNNAALQARVDDLRVRYEQIDELRAEYAQVEKELSPNEDTQAVRRLIYNLATTYGVTITSDTMAVPTYVTVGGSYALAAAVVGETSYTEGVVFEGLFSTTISLRVVGSYENVTKFVTALQLGDHRYFLVTASDLTPIMGQASDAAEGSSDSLAAKSVALEVTFFTLDTTVIPVDPTAVNPGSGVAPGTVPPDPTASPVPSAPAAPSASPSP